MDFDTLRLIHTLLSGELSERERELEKDGEHYRAWQRKNPTENAEQNPYYKLVNLEREWYDTARKAYDQFHAVKWGYAFIPEKGGETDCHGGEASSQ